MNRKLMWLFFLSCGVSLGEALKCYECKARQDRDCYSPINEENIPARNCRYSGFISRHYDNAEYECVAYLEHYHSTNSTTVGRHCVLKNSFDCASYARFRGHSGFTVEKCNVCEDDLCNSGQKSMEAVVLISIFALIGRLCV